MDILAIGNSFSQDATRYLHDMLADVGIPSRVVNLYIGGCSLQRHYANMQSDAQDYSYELNGAATGKFIGLHAALTERNWDVITFQQASHDSGIAESYYPYLPELLAYARSLCPDARYMLHQTWAYEIDSTHEAFARYGRSQARMYAQLCAAYSAAAKRTGLELIRSGDAVQALRREPEFDYAAGGRSLCRDGFHMDLIYGRYLLGAVWFEALSGRKVTECGFVPTGSDAGEPVDSKLIYMIRAFVAKLFN